MLSIGTPLILLYFIVKYKNQIEGSRIGFWHGVQFSMLLFFYAGLIEAGTDEAPLYDAAIDKWSDETVIVRAYAPVGGHEELLPYLVRRLLESGANSSFVHALLDERVPVEALEFGVEVLDSVLRRC